MLTLVDILALEKKGKGDVFMTMVFMIWAICGAAFIVLGIYDSLSKREVAFGFWANAETFPVTDVKAYNKAVGKLFCVFGIVFIILGIPLLGEQNSPLILLSIVGTMFEVIAAMVVYVTVVEKKYRKKD